MKNHKTRWVYNDQAFIMIKPDGVQRGLWFSFFTLIFGEIICRFEKKGFSLKGLKLISVERAFAEKHYEDLSSKPFFKGKSVVSTCRNIIGATNPAASTPGTIRGDYAVEIG
ncbi:hypothetical protein C5167_000365, partial [Papaver somniferum]